MMKYDAIPPPNPRMAGGTFLVILGAKPIERIVIIPTTTPCHCHSEGEPSPSHSEILLENPKSLGIWPRAIRTATPERYPLTTGNGMNLMRRPPPNVP